MEYTYKKEEHSKTHVTYTVTVPYSEHQKVYERIFSEESLKIDIKGFRKGKAPKEMVEPMIYKDVMQKTIEELIPRVTSEILKKENVNPASYPKYEVTKIDEKDGIIYTAEFYLYISFEIPELSKLKITKPKVSVTSKDVETAIENVLKEWNEHNKDDKFESVNDEFVKKLQIENVKNVDEFKKMIEKELAQYKNQMEEQTLLRKTLEKAVDLSNIIVSENIVENIIEAERKGLEQYLKEKNKTKEEYLKEIKKSEKDLEKEWIERNKKEVQINMFLSEYGTKNKVQISPDIIKALKEKYGEKDLMHVVERVFLDMSARHFWSEIKKLSNWEEPKKIDIVENMSDATSSDSSNQDISQKPKIEIVGD
ncbi:MAG TPA: trigger factor [Candidatus Dojkabacteria bacterium]|nr:trigger factor [Candidatus Dojkabacteria bacterium]HQF36243.1 trigger factor [Candidatus Dojkabacteria bacterium]